MSATHDFEQRIADHYAAEAPPRAPDWVLERILDSVDATPQRQAVPGWPWKFPATPSTLAKLGATAMAIAAVGLLGLMLSMGPVIGPAATPSPSPSPSTSPAVSGEPTTSDSMWPQTSLEEVRQAQELADAGDPRYTWQVSTERWYQPGQNHPTTAEFFARFIEEQLGWEAFRWDEALGHRDGLLSGDVVYVRCAPGGANPLYPDDTEAGCGPTIDDLRYETVKIHVAQPVRPEDPTGIWVVTDWEMVEPAEQVAPLSDAEIAALLDPFLQARIDGTGAGGLVDVAEDGAGERVREVPLLYATSNGAAYERAEFEIVDGPVWPDGGMTLQVRLFAENGATVVEQVFALQRDEAGRVGLAHDFLLSTPDGTSPTTTENGQPVPLTYELFGGAVTYRATYPLEPSQDEVPSEDRVDVSGLLPDDGAPRRILSFLMNARPFGSGCPEAPASDAPASDAPTPVDVEGLVRSIQSDPDFEGDDPVAVTIGGRSALQVDGAAVYETPCGILLRAVPSADGGGGSRLYLLDLPGGSPRVLGIWITADEDSFQTVLDWAMPVLDSIEFHTP